ncbi:MAG: HAMP domain-containing histidine kinase [Proteobacteria bacterium]|nr:HAMP domain-containing histidine kinase [Pseudomonadota bacterium]
MFFDHPGGGEHPPVRSEATIHAIYRKMFSLVKSMHQPDDIARSLIITLQGLYGADGTVLCHIFDDAARFVSAIGTLSHMEKMAFDMSSPKVANFLSGNKAIILARENLPQEMLNIALNARFESLLLSPIAINGMPFGLIALVSNQKNYFEAGDADTLYQLTLFLSMLLANRAYELSENEKKHCRRLGETCRQLAPGLHTATIDLIQTFAQIRKNYVSQKYAPMAEHLAAAVGNIENMAKRIQDLRTLGDICLPKEQDLTNIELKSVIENVIEYNHSQIEEVATLNLTIRDGLPSIYGEFTLLWQVIHEIVQNALRAMAKNPERTDHVLTIYAYPLPGVAAVEISDTGCGIMPADVPHIFEPFFTTWPPCRGLGLTRALVNVLSLNGQIYYHPVERGGSTFRMTFPDAQHAPQEEVF